MFFHINLQTKHTHRHIRVYTFGEFYRVSFGTETYRQKTCFGIIQIHSYSFIDIFFSLSLCLFFYSIFRFYYVESFWKHDKFRLKNTFTRAHAHTYIFEEDRLKKWRRRGTKWAPWNLFTLTLPVPMREQSTEWNKFTHYVHIYTIIIHILRFVLIYFNGWLQVKRVLVWWW